MDKVPGTNVTRQYARKIIDWEPLYIERFARKNRFDRQKLKVERRKWSPNVGTVGNCRHYPEKYVRCSHQTKDGLPPHFPTDPSIVRNKITQPGDVTFRAFLGWLSVFLDVLFGEIDKFDLLVFPLPQYRVLVFVN